MINNEFSDTNIKRNMEQIVKYVDECSKFNDGNCLYENENFLNRLAQSLNNLL